MSENSDDNNITLSSLIKRRQQVAALAAYHRKTWRKADGSPSLKDNNIIASENPLSRQPTKENILQVKATSQQEHIQQYDPNKKIKVLSNIIVKKSSFRESPQQQPSNMFSQVIKTPNTLVLTHVETQELSLDATSLQRPATSTPAETSSIDLSPIVSYQLENIEDDSDATSCGSPQLLSNFPSAEFEISGTVDTCTETPDQSLDATLPTLAFQQPAASTLTEASSNDLRPIMCLQLENLVEKSDATSCGSPQLPSNLPAAVEVSGTDDTHAKTPDQSLGATPPTSTLQQPAVLSPTAAPNNDADHPLANILEKSSDVKSSTRATYSNAKVNKSENFDNKEDTNISDLLLLQQLEPDISDIRSETSNVEIDKPTKKRKRLTTSKKAFIDFLSDEEKQDFSGGSSDLWTCNESDVSSDEMEHIKKKKKKTKKSDIGNTEIKKKEKPINKRKLNKTLKNEGKSYESRQGEIKAEKAMKNNPCVANKCVRGCYEISEQKRTSLFEYYWRLDAQRRKDWIVHSAHKIPIKRRKTDNDFSRRNITYEYYINDGEGHKQVCQKFLLNTLDITQKYITYTLANAKEGMSQKDMRKPNVSKKYTDDAKQFATTFIKTLPAVPSHYNRQRTNRTYLPQEMKNISNLFQMYLKECDIKGQQALSEHLFRSTFNDFNISFHIPKKDKCAICVKAENSKGNMSQKDEEQLNLHKKEKIATYKRFKIHQNLNSPENETVTCSFDLQKVLNTPHGKSMLLYYSRKYSVYNFTVYESGTQDGYCYTWGESDGKRGSNEIASCLIKYLEEADKKGVRHLLMYCDSCCGQNKNKVVLAAVNNFLKSAVNLKVIQLNFLLPGHTYMPVDSVHAVIEREVQKLIVWSPSQWPTYFETARKRPRPYKVCVMEYSDFLSFEQLANNTFTSNTLKNIKFKNIRVASFKKKNTDHVYIKYSMEEDAETYDVTLFEKPSAKGKGKGKGKAKGKGQLKGNKSKPNCEIVQDVNENTVHQLYNGRLPIAVAKHTDLMRLCDGGIIPKRFHHEYRALPCSSKVEDYLNETDIEDNSDSDQEEI